ncbi:MAG TPA: 3-phosphoshikimate 1-carboxyvinyltransferase [Thermoplasmata archaeon]|nr:3-phosphoshikimate 1-carboxyvinyltransferase [Thermoplasmata archaeon]
MTSRRIRGSTVSGEVLAPPSKSYTHRELVASFLADGPSRIVGPSTCDDVLATRRALERLGARVEREAQGWIVTPPSSPPNPRAVPTIDCRESGTTLRFVSALSATRAQRVRLVGSASLARRPMTPLLETLRSAGAHIAVSSTTRSLPLSIEGPIGPMSAILETSASSQFLSALLLTLPSVPGRSVLRLAGQRVSRPYVAASIATLGRRGVSVRLSDGTVSISGGQRYKPGRFSIPGDASSAAYLWAAAALSGGRVRVRGIDQRFPQADLVLLDLLESMGASVHRRADGAEVHAASLRGTSVDLSDAPDLLPLAGVLAALSRGRSHLRGAPHARWKESDRRAESARLARAFGAKVRTDPDALTIEGAKRPRAVALIGLRDHRLVMSAAVGALAVPEVSVIGEAESVSKSFPSFWGLLRTIGARFSVDRT